MEIRVKIQLFYSLVFISFCEQLEFSRRGKMTQCGSHFAVKMWDTDGDYSSHTLERRREIKPESPVRSPVRLKVRVIERFSSRMCITLKGINVGKAASVGGDPPHTWPLWTSVGHVFSSLLQRLFYGVKHIVRTVYLVPCALPIRCETSAIHP